MSVKQILQTKALFYFASKGLEVISRTNEDFQEEFEDLDGIFQWNVGEDNVSMYLIADEGKFDAYLDATHDDPSVIMKVADYDKAKEILRGEIDGTSAYMAGDLQIEGDLQMALKFTQVANYLLEALSDLLS